MPQILPTDEDAMQLAIQFARQGFGSVEPNPMVGAVIMAPNRELIASGYHERFGKAHAEINAIRAAGEKTRGADLYVTLEPCSHFGKTPPCAEAVISAGFRRVIIGCQDPAPHVAGRGIQKLKDSGIDVVVGICEAEARRLIAPFRRFMLDHRPWVIAKWAMTLDGRIATCTGDSRWISSEASRRVVHDLRGRVDAIITGAGTVRADDPELTARPTGPRTAMRVVIDSTGESLTRHSRLIGTVTKAPLLVCVSSRCKASTRENLIACGADVHVTDSSDVVDVSTVLRELGRRGCTNAMVEAGPGLLGSFFDQKLIDEVHVFIAPKLSGGAESPGPIGGLGISKMFDASACDRVRSSMIGTDLLIQADCSV